MESHFNNEELKYFNKNYNFNSVLSVPIILNQIFQFLDKDKVKCLSLCNKKIYQIYCNQVKKLRIKRKAEISNIQVLINKYENFNNLDLSGCKNIKDFTIISKLEKLENLNVTYTNISDISFLEKNKNIKELYLYECKNIEDFTHISKLERLENLNVSFTNISDISFLEKNKNIKKLHLNSCKNIEDFTIISKLEKLESLDVGYTNISDISFLEKNKNINNLNLYGCDNIKK